MMYLWLILDNAVPLNSIKCAVQSIFTKTIAVSKQNTTVGEFFGERLTYTINVLEQK